ncbi:MAG: saccharopine dehydrogenase NADP-binding domain-containing protein, partial [Solirubrobacteraceae bacterium]
MAARIVVFGATGYTGRLVAERLAAAGARPVLAGRSEPAVRELAERLGTEWRRADSMRQNTVFALLERGDVLVSLVGPFARWGEPAVRAAIAAKGTYVDSTGEPAFIRRVFEEWGPPAARAGAALLPAMGYDFVPGALAGALALEEAGAGAVRVDVGYYAFGAGISAGTRRSAVGVALDEGRAFRDGALQRVRTAERVRSFLVRGREREAVSIGGAEHFTLPPEYPRLREVNVYLGWFGGLARPLQAASLAGSAAL